MPEPGHHLYARGILIGALLLAAVANLAEFKQIDRSIGTIYAAVNRYETADVATLGIGHSPTVRERFQLYLELRRWAPGAEIWLAPRAGLGREQLAGLGGAAEISSWDGEYRLTEDERARIDAHIVATGEDRWAGEFTLAVVPEGVERIITLKPEGTLLLVDVRLLEELDG